MLWMAPLLDPLVLLLLSVDNGTESIIDVLPMEMFAPVATGEQEKMMPRLVVSAGK